MIILLVREVCKSPLEKCKRLAGTLVMGGEEEQSATCLGGALPIPTKWSVIKLASVLPALVLPFPSRFVRGS
jgi:hypothetical protein